MSVAIRFLGVAGYEIVSDSQRILIDPFLRGNHLAPMEPAEVETPDVILVSHAAPDHLGDTAEIAKATGAPVVCGADVRLNLIDAGVPAEQVRATVWGIVVEVGGVIVRPVECRHWSMTRLSDGQYVTGTPMAFIVEPEPGVRIYHYGDTAIFDMRLVGELYRPGVGLLGCAQPRELEHLVPGPGRILTGEMSPDEAARTAEMLGVSLAVATHYITPDEDVAAFLELVGMYDSTGTRRATAPAVGDTITVEADELAVSGGLVP